MKRRPTLVKLTLAALALWLCACGVQLGGRAGVSTIEQPARYAASGRLSGLVIIPRAPVIGGIEIEGTTRGKVGAIWSIGLTAGFRLSPDERAFSPGLELLAHGGARLQDSVLRVDKEWYFGASVGLPLWLGVSRTGAGDYNQRFFIATDAIEAIPFLSVLARRVPDEMGQRVITLELTVGLTLRLRFLTDLL